MYIVFVLTLCSLYDWESLCLHVCNCISLQRIDLCCAYVHWVVCIVMNMCLCWCILMCVVFFVMVGICLTRFVFIWTSLNRFEYMLCVLCNCVHVCGIRGCAIVCYVCDMSSFFLLHVFVCVYMCVVLFMFRFMFRIVFMCSWLCLCCVALMCVCLYLLEHVSGCVCLVESVWIELCLFVCCVWAYVLIRRCCVGLHMCVSF